MGDREQTFFLPKKEGNELPTDSECTPDTMEGKSTDLITQSHEQLFSKKYILTTLLSHRLLLLHLYEEKPVLSKFDNLLNYKDNEHSSFSYMDSLRASQVHYSSIYIFLHRCIKLREVDNGKLCRDDLRRLLYILVYVITQMEQEESPDLDCLDLIFIAILGLLSERVAFKETSSVHCFFKRLVKQELEEIITLVERVARFVKRVDPGMDNSWEKLSMLTHYYVCMHYLRDVPIQIKGRETSELRNGKFVKISQRQFLTGHYKEYQENTLKQLVQSLLGSVTKSYRYPDLWIDEQNLLLEREYNRIKLGFKSKHHFPVVPSLPHLKKVNYIEWYKSLVLLRYILTTPPSTTERVQNIQAYSKQVKNYLLSCEVAKILLELDCVSSSSQHPFSSHFTYLSAAQELYSEEPPKKKSKKSNKKQMQSLKNKDIGKKQAEAKQMSNRSEPILTFSSQEMQDNIIEESRKKHTENLRILRKIKQKLALEPNLFINLPREEKEAIFTVSRNPEFVFTGDTKQQQKHIQTVFKILTKTKDRFLSAKTQSIPLVQLSWHKRIKNLIGFLGIDKVREAQLEVYGGTVRDLIAGIDPNDFDLRTILDVETVVNIFASKLNISSNRINASGRIHLNAPKKIQNERFITIETSYKPPDLETFALDSCYFFLADVYQGNIPRILWRRQGGNEEQGNMKVNINELLDDPLSFKSLNDMKVWINGDFGRFIYLTYVLLCICNNEKEIYFQKKLSMLYEAATDISMAEDKAFISVSAMRRLLKIINKNQQIFFNAVMSHSNVLKLFFPQFLGIEALHERQFWEEIAQFSGDAESILSDCIAKVFVEVKTKTPTASFDEMLQQTIFCPKYFYTDCSLIPIVRKNALASFTRMQEAVATPQRHLFFSYAPTNNQANNSKSENALGM